MNTDVTFQNRLNFKTMRSLGLAIVCYLLTLSVAAQNTTAQESFTVKGIITSETGPLEGVNIYHKKSKTGTVSKSDGRFTFPEPLRVGDVLVFSYLGYVKQSITIKSNTTQLEIALEEAPIDILSAVNSNTAYKSKRQKSN